MKKILIIEDDKKLNDGIRLALKSDEFQFFQRYTLAEGMKVISKEKVDLILLDINLPTVMGLIS